MKLRMIRTLLVFASSLLVVIAARCAAQDYLRVPADSSLEQIPAYLSDRGTGMSTSMFGTFVRQGELIVYPFFEFDHSNNYSYNPNDEGYGNNEDYQGRYTSTEGLIFLGYGISDALSVEVEAALQSATLNKALEDNSPMPAKISESGLGDVETQLRWSWAKETETTPEFYANWETVFPLQKNRMLLGTHEWEVNLGAGAIKGFSWGTIAGRAAVELGGFDSFDFGEWAVEYIKRFSDTWRIYAGIEGSGEEVSVLGEVQLHLSPHLFIKLNNGIGLTSEAIPWAPEIGVVFSSSIF